MILCFKWEDLTKTFLLSKFDTNRPNIKLITDNILCHMTLLGLKG